MENKDKKDIRRSTELFSVRVRPWPIYMLKAYAKMFDYSLLTTFELAIFCLMADVPEKTKERWLKEFKKQVGRHGLD